MLHIIAINLFTDDGCVKSRVREIWEYLFSQFEDNCSCDPIMSASQTEKCRFHIVIWKPTTRRMSYWMVDNR